MKEKRKVFKDIAVEEFVRAYTGLSPGALISQQKEGLPSMVVAYDSTKTEARATKLNDELKNIISISGGKNTISTKAVVLSKVRKKESGEEAKEVDGFC